MLFRILYIIFFYSILVLGSTYIGPVTPRQIMAIVMFAVCLKEKEIKIDKYFRVYMFFIMSYLIAGVFTGFFLESIKNVIAFYFVSYVAYESTKILIGKYNGMEFLCNAFLSFGLINAFVSICQMYQLPYANAISTFLLGNSINEIYDVMAIRSQDNMFGYTVPGLVGPVPNGYLMSLIVVLSLYNKDGVLKIKNIVMFCLFLYTSFIIQERTALVSCILISSYCLYNIITKTPKGKTKLWIYMFVFVAFVIVLTYAPSFYTQLMSGDSRYSYGFSLQEERGEISDTALDYILNNPLGGINEFLTNGHYPHNILLNAFIYGGFLGGVSIIILLIIQFKIVLKSLNWNRVSSHSLFFFAAIYTCYTLNSLTHNLSLVTGDPTIWIVWGAILSKYELDNMKLNQI